LGVSLGFVGFFFFLGCLGFLVGFGGFVGLGAFGVGLGVDGGFNCFGVWVSRGFCLCRVSVEVFVSYIFRVY
jgi:hypothetical protein